MKNTGSCVAACLASAANREKRLKAEEDKRLYQARYAVSLSPQVPSGL